MKIKETLKLPIKYLLQKKVESYERELERINAAQEKECIKSRQMGKTSEYCAIMLRYIYLEAKYRNFINNWKLKN